MLLSSLAAKHFSLTEEKKDRWKDAMSPCPSVTFLTVNCSSFEEGRSETWPYLLCLCSLSLPAENKGMSLLWLFSTLLLLGYGG